MYPFGYKSLLDEIKGSKIHLLKNMITHNSSPRMDQSSFQVLNPNYPLLLLLLVSVFFTPFSGNSKMIHLYKGA